ncbi:MAG: hypothetical protein JWQ40_1786, partial [Segetibacter sp.]|nr:hypothetical protein [Segetibacter sp.]
WMTTKITRAHCFKCKYWKVDFPTGINKEGFSVNPCGLVALTGIEPVSKV